MQLEITFHSDPSHGWAEIPHQFVNALGIGQKISRYSYQDAINAYLEEDCDLATFMQTAKAQGWEITFKEKHTDNDSFIRNFPRYTTGA